MRNRKLNLSRSDTVTEYSCLEGITRTMYSAIMQVCGRKIRDRAKVITLMQMAQFMVVAFQKTNLKVMEN